ncbi:Extracellular solute-binding protein family 1 [uncultured spirochete]|jgi:multiple sugar transport system substrate-binding protein|uniref:Extracellular solute-binding protein family 1 n=1 Tax=uncultured spirochete TaxID=156406 RepID=A0A3P3XQD2_9SPIR|nr:Extracellular solute-binding protein family 1 [uncultured spirochete]
MKRIGLVLFTLLMSATIVFAQSGSVTLRWAYWGSESRIKRSQQAIDLFMAANPGIAVNPEISGGTGDHFNKVDTQIAGGSGPDIVQMGGNISDYVKRGVLLPLDKYVGSVLNTSVIDPSAIESGTIDGHLYGVSTGVTMPALVYNKSLLQRVGAPLPKVSMTYPEFRAYLVSIKSRLPAGVYPMQDIGALSSNSTPFGYWTRYNGTPLYNAETNMTAVTSAAAQKYLELFKDYRDNGLVPPADIASGFAETNADTSMIIAGKAAIGFIWTNQLNGYQAATTDELGLIEFPGAAATKALWQAPSQFYTVNKYSKNPELAVKFINFLVNSPEAAKVLGNDRGASASSTARAAGSTNVNDQKVLEYLNSAGPHSSKETTHLPNDTEFNSTLFLIYQRVAFGQISPATGGQQIYDLITRLIKK